ncbi:MAG: putative bifunctional diguanylate cyclase/phosphodiesterase, partial [Burkholderiales bacterium]
GGWKWLHAKGRVTERDASGRAKRVSGIVADIEARRRSDGALNDAEERLRELGALSSEYLWETDADWCYAYLSQRAEALLGYTRSELLGRRAWDFLPLGEERAIREWFASHGGEGQPFRDLVHRVMTKSGGVLWQSLSALPLTDRDGRWCGYRGTAADVSSRKLAEAKIEQLATRDSLTGLANRALLAERGAEAVAGAARARAGLAVLAVDLDRFRLVNESLGHAAGDALVRAVAERLAPALKREDTLARLGGDDFVLVCNGVKSHEEAASHATRLLGLLARAFSVEGRTLTMSASIGIALYPEDGRDFGELLRAAEAALHAAKEAGRATFRFFEPALTARATEQLDLANELRGALARSELLLHWQPVMRGRGTIAGAEALVRWRHPRRGLIGPDEFVPLAEDAGLIRAVGEWTLERALSQAGAWSRELAGEPWFALNVSAAELAQGEAFVARVRSALEANRLAGERLELEVTERVLMTNLGENVETLRRIGALGVRLSIDDFGTGYSSLAYLRELPIHKLKIDRLFVRNIATNAADQAILRAIAELAATLGIAAAAEGVESEAQLERLFAAGCELWQGHLFSPPVEAAQLAALVQAAARNEKRA